jgi:hypothetical protein
MRKCFAIVFLLSVFSLCGQRQLSAQGSDWVPCADEGGPCNIPPNSGAVLIRFGDGQKFLINEYQNVNSPPKCNRAEFGDPSRGQDKKCSYRLVPSFEPGTMRKLVDEGQQVSFSVHEDKPVDLLFGTDDQWVHNYYSHYSGSCATNDFMWDPSPGNRKYCRISNQSVVPPDAEWKTCATEDQSCTIGDGIGTVLIRYGVKGKNWLYRLVAADSIICNNNTFVGVFAYPDPDRGDTKFCDIMQMPTVMGVYGRWHFVVSAGGKGTISHGIATSVSGSRQDTHSKSYSFEVAVEMSREWPMGVGGTNGKFGVKVSTKFGTTDVTTVSDTITRQTTNTTTVNCPAGVHQSQLWQWGVDVDEACFAKGTCTSHIDTIKYLCVADPPDNYQPTVSPSLCADDLCTVQKK